MRIFTAIRHANDPKQYYSGLWSANFYPALRELGDELVESQTDLLPTSKFMDVAGDFTREELEVRARTTERILDEVHEAQRHGPVHLFLSYFYNAHFDPAGFDELRRLGIPSVNFYCNSIYQFSHVAEIARKSDFSWHAERDARDSYLAVGGNPVWVQMGADPKVYFPMPGQRRQTKTVFLGQRYVDRDRWIAALLRAGITIDIYGPGWGAVSNEQKSAILRSQTTRCAYLGRSHFRPGTLASYWGAFQQVMQDEGMIRGLNRSIRLLAYRRETQKLSELFVPHACGAVPFKEIAAIFSRYEVCLNFSNVWADGRPGSRLIPHVRLRDFEAPMCRTCYLTGHTEEITEFYKVEREIDTYRTPDELIEKSRFYLSHPNSAERLREGGYRRALRDHTWKCRFEELFRKLNLAR
jgi:spore maturation protein CgeB